jgi:DNA-binding transcriptional ArsR family regulator
MDIDQMQEKAGVATELLKVLANENRLQIVCQLVDGEKSVNELEARVGIRQSAMSQHLAILRREKIVKTRRESQFIYYSLESREAKTILKTLYGMYCGPKK